MIKIGFFGTPEIARYCFERLNADFEIVFALTCEDKPQGRCLNVCCTPVKDEADKLGVPVLQPSSLKDESTAKDIASYGADIFVVVAFGKIIPRSIFALPRLGTINLHPSLLPKYRGAAPIQWALINGEKRSGVTVQLIEEKLDAGDVVLQKEFEIDQNENSDELYERILPFSYELLRDSIRLLADGSAAPVKQIEADATHCRKIDRDTAKIHFTDSALHIHNLIRGLNPKPGAWCEFRGKNLKIWQSLVPGDVEIPDLPAGTLFRVGKKRLFVCTGEGALELVRIQPENKKILTAVEFINGTRLADGEQLL